MSCAFWRKLLCAIEYASSSLLTIFTATILARKFQNCFPNATFTFDPKKQSDSVSANWPDIIHDDHAHNDWGWKHRYDFDDTIEALLEIIN